MRIIYLTTEDRGGMAHYAANLASAIQRLANGEVCVVRESQSDPSVWCSVPVMFVDRSARGSPRRVLEKYDPAFYRRIVAAIGDRRPQVVHITAASNGLHALISECRNRGVRTVFTFHDPTPHEERTTKWGRFVQVVQRHIEMPAALRSVDAVHVHSDLHAKAVSDAFGMEVYKKTYVVHHGAGLSPSIAAGTMIPPEMRRIHPDRPTILCFGRIEPYKGVDLLVDAARALAERGILVNVVIAGSGNLANKLPLPENVVAINRFIEDSEVRPLFRSADLVVLPYRSATQSGVVPMAYAFGKAVLVTRVGALEEVVVHGRTGLCIEPGDVAALTESIQHLVSRRDVLIEMGGYARELADGKLSWNEAARQHLSHYEHLVGRGGQGCQG